MTITFPANFGQLSKRLEPFVVAFLLCLNLVSQDSLAADSKSPQYFDVNPYLQLGKSENGSSVNVLWISKNSSKNALTCTYRVASTKDWKQVKQIETRSVNGHPELTIFTCTLVDLPAGKTIEYSIGKDNKVIFQSSFQSAPSSGAPVKFLVFGDCGKGSEGQAAIAARIRQSDASLAVLPGDIVYPIGTIHFYKRHFFPYFNSEANAEHGQTLMRSKIFVGCAGNHDVAEGGSLDARDLNTSPDSMSYFVLFDQPLNGPIAQAEYNTPNVTGTKSQIDDFLKASGARYPRMANFSFDYGDAHFLVLDANRYMDWDDPGLRRWVEENLKQAKTPWKFVVYHQPGFNSDMAHREEQRMRKLADIFERTGVDICFSGHSHSYQRSMPLHFSASKVSDQDHDKQLGFVMGKFKLDRVYDGVKSCKPNGVIYLVTGAGGAPLTHPQLEDDSSLWLPFTKKFACRQFSFTSCKINGRTLQVEQTADDGSVLDQFTITK